MVGGKRTSERKGRAAASAAESAGRSNGAPSAKPRKKRKGWRKVRKLSRLRPPDDMTLEAWQVALRREFGRSQRFRLKNLGSDPLFSEFEVTNPQTKRSYRVAIRGAAPGVNYCSCPDFAVNSLGTCKHIEFALGRLARGPHAKRRLAAGFRPTFSEVYLRYGARREICFQAGTECPAALRKLAGRYFDAQGRLCGGAEGRLERFLKSAAEVGHELRCYDDALAFLAQVRDAAARIDRIDKAFPRGERSAAFKRLLKVEMYPYQREGALFAARAGRCLIADDMGLGKTLQAIAAVEILVRTVGLERVLIVAPTSLKHQWQREIEKFSSRSSLVVEGLLAQRQEAYRQDAFYKITNYDVVHRDQQAIAAWGPDLIILDEAQRIKNWKTRTAQAVKRLESQHALVLTGTPLENRLEELYSIVEFVDRHRLGPMFRFLANHQHVDQSGRVVGYRDLSKISQTLEPILVRRTKKQVLPQLPQRMEKQLFVPMTPEQMKHHEENREIVGRLVAKWRRWGFLSETDQRRLMIALQNMRMACNSTYLLDKKTDFGVKADELVEILGEMLEDPQRKVVIFSQWVRMHELIVRRLKQQAWKHVFFHGGVPGPKRKDLVNRFREDPECRLFLATDSGGVGLNLQHASAVLNLDQPWNPAVLEQRIGRVHRLGQRQPVRVVHLIAQGTIEEGMLNLLGFKRSMFSGVLDGGQDEVFLGGTRLSRFMQTVEKATTGIPPAMPLQTSGENGDHRSENAASGEAESPESSSEVPVSVPMEPWAAVVAQGLSVLEKLGQTLHTGPMPPSQPGQALEKVAVERDPHSGHPYVRLPLPEPQALQRLLDAVAGFIDGLRRQP